MAGQDQLRGTRIEFHILQSFPVTCLNRDDVGAPKSAIVGGVPRARVSSQCWKRQVRMALRGLGIKIGVRTKDVGSMIAAACVELGATAEQADACGKAVAPALTDNTLLFFSGCEAGAIAEFASRNGFAPEALLEEKSAAKGRKNAGGADEKPKKGTLSKELRKVLKNALNPAADGLDIALFGRMVAQDPDMNMEAAASFAHAISTHRAVNEVEFFTALDDLQPEEETGSAHMGALEYNSATYYRYISLDLGQLAENLRGRNLADAVAAFTKAIYIAVPAARQTTQTGLCPWDYARVLVRRGQGMQVCFDEPVRALHGYLEPSRLALDKKLERQKTQAGSLYGGLADYTFGGDAALSIDELAEKLAAHVRPHEAAE